MTNGLLKLKDLTTTQIQDILSCAQKIKDSKYKPQHHDKLIANLFFESSTRTHYSFITAEHKLKCRVLDFSPASSSLNKGESFYDTLKTFSMFHPDAIVVRSAIDAWYNLVKNIKIPFINAGDGARDHPTQTLLDLMTIQQEFHTFKNLTILVVGDIIHSRVAHSNIETMKRLGMKVLVSAPKEFQDKQYTYIDFEKGLKQADVINMLRIQNERLSSRMSLSIQSYNKAFGLNNARVKMMKPKAIIIHPAPVNRNVEINDDVMECKHSRIFKQIENGVYIRMAVLDWVLKNANTH